MNYSSLITKLNISIFLIWLFHVSGIIGIIYTNTSWFIGQTPINLILSFSLLLINTKLSKSTLLLFIGCFTVGMLITPPDVISQSLLAIPAWILFELGIVMAKILVEKKDQKS